MKLTIIKNDEQYYQYCDILENLAKQNSEQEDLMAHLTLLIEDYQRKDQIPRSKDPVKLIQGLMKDRELSVSELARQLNVSKSLVSDILNYRRAISKEMVSKLSGFFMIRAEILLEPYEIEKMC